MRLRVGEATILTKRIKHPLPDGQSIGLALQWCHDNGIPALFAFEIGRRWIICSGRPWRDGIDKATFDDSDSLIVREQDYDLVRLRF